jgi:hypothetical protein
MALADAEVVAVDERAADDAGRERDAPWVVLVDTAGRVVAVATSQEASAHGRDALLPSLLRSRRVVVIAHAESSVVNGIASWAFERAGWDRDREVVVVVRDETRVWGVWHGPDLAEVLEIGATRSGIDTSLAGDVNIPELLRHCAYTDGRVHCGAAMTFSEFPGPAPACPNPSGLADHPFLW